MKYLILNLETYPEYKSDPKGCVEKLLDKQRSNESTLAKASKDASPSKDTLAKAELMKI